MSVYSSVWEWEGSLKRIAQKVLKFRTLVDQLWLRRVGLLVELEVN